MKKKILLLFALALSGTVHPVAASGLPPVFGPEYEGVARKDELTRAYISPVRIVWMYDGDGRLVKDADVLLRPGDSQADMAKTPKCRMISTENEKPSILLDYGKEIHGGLQLVMGGSSNRAPSLVRIRFGESVGEANSQTHNLDWKVGYSTDDHAKRDIVMEVPRSGLIEIGNTGFRFVRIDLLENNTTINIKEARAVLRYRDIPYLGSFHSSDPRLNDIWMTGAYTVHLNMQEYLWDGIKRDRVVWLGDMHPELVTITRVFGYNEVIPKSLDLSCRQWPLPGWMNNMSAYSLWYLINVHDWYRYTGDTDFLETHREYLTGLIDLIDGKIDADGNEHLASWRFLDWPSSPNEAGVESGYRALMVWALEEARELCRVLGEKDSERKCADAADRLRRKILPHNGLKQAAALMSIAGLILPREATDQVAAVGGAKGFSTFYGYYMLEALARSGDYELALDIIRQYWGGMLDMGATTFWEDFNLEWTENACRLDEICPPGKKDIHGDFGDYCYPGFRHSFCHGWSSGPTAWLSEHVLGIRIAEPGCKTLIVSPNLGDLEWVEGTFPTPYGVVKVSHTRKKDGTIETRVEAPRGIRIIRS